ncbi:MAG TPA: nitrate reductase [Acidimicrobiales bacterium]|nr:nitrate reductase [Acidimicrobiales bacterium]
MKDAAVSRLLGLGTSAGDYAYEDDERFGPMSTSRAPDEWVKTTCGYCSVGCGMLLGVRGGRAVAVKGDPDHPVNVGRLCPKGLSEHHAIHVDTRILRPRIRIGKTEPQWDVGWNRALRMMTEGFSAVLGEYGPEAVAVLSTGQLVTEEFYTLGKLVRGGLGLRHFDGNTTLCMSSAVSGYKRSFGSDGPPGAYADIEEADCILLVGANVADNHPLLAPRLLANENATVIVVDPRVTKTAMVADVHLAIKPRSDVTLLNGILKILIDEALIDREYIDAHTEGFDELAAHVAAFDLARVAAECGVDAEAVRRVALAIGRADKAFIAWTMGVNHSVQGTETVTLLNTLAAVTGNIGKPGAAPFSITGQCNAMGTRESGGTASLPGYRNWDSLADRTEIADLWNIPVDRLPTARGRAYPDIIDGILDGTIRALWIIATNPPVSFPYRSRLERALADLDLLVVQDGYESPTTELADVVLPAAVWGEKDGTYTNSERRVSRVRKAVEPPGEAMSDFEIFLRVGREFGVADELFAGWTTTEDAFNEWRRVSAGRLCDYSEMTWDAIEERGGIQWGGPRLYTDGQFPTESGRARLWCVDPQPISDATDTQYPFVLNTGRTVEHWHTRTKTGRIDVLDQLAPEGWVEVNPIDAATLRFRPGDLVNLVSRRGRVDAVPVRVTATVRAGEVFVPFHYNERCVNRLTVDEFDPISREPNYKQSAVRLEPYAQRRGASRARSR